MADFLLWIAPFMGLMSRSCGGGPPKLPLGLAQWLYALPYLFTALFCGWWSAVGYLIAVAGKRLGHGRGFEYDKPLNESASPERVELLIGFLRGRIDDGTYKALIMLLTGIAPTLGAAMLCALNHQAWPAYLLVLSGGAKAFAYELKSTEKAEIVTGLFAGIGVASALYYIL